MLALALISLPFGASALEVRADENAEPVVHIFTAEHVSFEYDPGDVVSQQTLRGAHGEVDQLLIQFVDPQSGERKNDAFVAIQHYASAPNLDGVSDAREAIAQNFIAQLNQRLEQRLHPSKMTDRLDQLSDVEGYQARIDAKDGAQYLRFFVTGDATDGYVLIVEQRALDDRDAQRAIERLLNSISLGDRG